MPIAYRSQSADTSIAADQLRFKLLRSRTCAERLEMAAAITRGARELSLFGLRQRFGHLPPSEFAQKVAQVWLNRDDVQPTGDEVTWVQDSLTLAAQLHPLLEQYGGYFLTGGVAATVYSEPRTTQDLDVVINVSAENLPLLIAEFEQQGFYVPGVDDIERIKTLQIIHQETIMQADLMMLDGEFDISRFARRRLIDIPGRGQIYFSSPEDVILSKLSWRKGSQSEKQWRDVLGVLKTQSEQLDVDYLRSWTVQLNVSDDLERAFGESGL